MTEKLEALKEKLAEVFNLYTVAALLDWDQQTYMPPGGAEDRAEQTALITQLAHERLVSDEVGRLLDDLSSEYSADDDSDGAALVRVTKDRFDRSRKLPSDFVAEMARHTALSHEVWVKARADNHFKHFESALEKLLDLKRRQTELVGYTDNRYDALLHDYEPYMKSAHVKNVFDGLRREIVPLVKAATQNAEAVSDAPIIQPFDIDKQRAFGEMVIKRFGFDFERGRQDVAVHPFCTTIGFGDIRLTTRYKDNDLGDALFSTMHEAGHGMYEQGIPKSFGRNLLAGSASLGVHESQSRLWENVIGRSRGFWSYFYPPLQETFPQLASTNVETFYRAINKSQPSFIRVEADELTYTLHIMLRFEIEQEMLDGKVRIAELPALWNAKMEDYLGIVPPTDTLGVLQDVHWSAGLMGYFPTYALGTILSVQLYEKALEAQPQIPAEMARGEFGSLLNWLRENVHRHGAKYPPAELIKRAIGGELDSAPYVKYLQTKYGELYGL